MFGYKLLISTRGPEAGVVTEFWLWFGVLGGAIAWLLHLLLAYGIAEFGCVSSWGERHWLGISLVAWLEALLSVSMLILCLFSWRIARRNSQILLRESGPSEQAGHAARVFMARSGELSGGLFGLIIAVQSIPFVFYWNGC